MRKCSKCGETKELDQGFYKLKSGDYTYSCKSCQSKVAAAWNRANREKCSASALKWRQEHRELDGQRAQAWVDKNKERRRAYYRDYYQKNLGKVRAQALQWAKDHPAVMNARSKERKARKMQAIPAWSNPDDIQYLYDVAKTICLFTGEKWHVDHIVPLKSKLVCGLHDRNNLRIISAFDNISKRNTHWPDMP